MYPSLAAHFLAASLFRDGSTVATYLSGAFADETEKLVKPSPEVSSANLSPQTATQAAQALSAGAYAIWVDKAIGVNKKDTGKTIGVRNMRELRVRLEEGFDGGLVIFRLTGNEIHRFHPKNGQSFRTTLAQSRFCFEVEIPSLGVFGSNAIVSGNDDVAIRLRLESNGVLAFELL